MSMKKWRKLAEEKSAIDQQTEEIHQKFRKDKINKEFGQLSGEEFFRPVTKRLDKSSTTVEEEEEEEQEFPDYTMDEFDETYLFGDEFKPDAPTPAPSPTPSPTPSPSPPPSPPPPSYQEVVDDDDDFPPPPQTLMEEKKSTRKEWRKPKPVKTEYSHEATLLQTVNQLITKFGNDPNYKVKSKNSPLYGYSMEELKKVRDGIYAKRGVTKTALEKQLQAGKYRLKSTPPHKKRETTPTPLEKAVMSRRPAFEFSDNEDDSYEQDWETQGSGFYDDEAEKLVNQLNLSFGSIKAGNNSIKLKKYVFYLLDSLVELGRINENQKKKIISLI